MEPAPQPRHRGRLRRAPCLATLAVAAHLFVPAAVAEPIPAGAARVDVTPQDRVHLINVKTPAESEAVAQPLYARALALGRDGEAVVLVSFDGIGVPRSLAGEVAARLERRHDLARDRIAVCATHTHWAPHLTDLLGNIYGGPLPGEHQRRVDAYTDFLADRLVEAADQALANRRPSHLAWATGRVRFAANRRLEEGGRLIRDAEKNLMVTWNPRAPVDHALPVLTVRNADSGELTALHFTYACHNVALTGTAISEFVNAIHGDWAGLAQEELEARHPGAVAICTIGCGGDLRPDFCGGPDVARSQALEIAEEVDRLLERDAWSPVAGPVHTAWRETGLPLEPMRPLTELRGFAEQKGSGAVGAARAFLARKRLREIEGGEESPSGVPFLAQSWRFREGPTLLFLAGEVCIDFQIRLKRKHGGELWPVAYANATPCYIVSRRMLERGGYEAGNSMFYYGWLRPLRPVAEDIVMDAAAEVLRAAHASRPHEAR